MDVSLESKSLPSVGNSRKSYLQVTSQRLARGKLVHLNGQRSLALPSVGPGMKMAAKFLSQRLISQPSPCDFAACEIGLQLVFYWNFYFSKKYVGEILDKFQMKDCNLINTPSEFGMKLNKDNGGKKIHGMSYRDSSLGCKKNFSDSDYAGDLDDRKNTSGYIFMMGTGVVSWSSKKKPIVTLSSTKAEFVVATACACQAIWDLTNDGVINLIYCSNEDQIADILTKSLKLPTFQKFRKLLGVCTSNI
ncbi:Retrovirus-related Pol polyprotein from transposon TNT 1-94 [Vitis vinifera]|uniref:Retrovirus-related Pol polyprotein from transposon TNT 1-94 n=1 Tax=Vitis vinifera TaxID=29760 RepID=A0A438GQZ7_VITVI|nr:Retrovirus-related Pol polyprotein from transposon TNT 1-94 [Vitis vinifera]